MTHLVWFACPGRPAAHVIEAYERVLAPLGDVSLVWITPAGFSSVFKAEALRYRRQGRTMPGLLRAYPPPGTAGPRTISLVCFSAGYGLAQILLGSEADREALDALVLLDGLHTSITSDASLEPFAAYAKRALAEEGALFWSGHSDVPIGDSDGDGRPDYKSTTAANAALVHMVGGLGGNFLVRDYDLYPPHLPQREHGAALVDWGAPFVAEALVPYLSTIVPISPPVPEPELLVPWQDPAIDLPSRAVEFSLAELEAGVCEQPPGSNTSPRIREYLAGCMRDGKRLCLTAANWCAAAACFAERQACLPGEEPIVPWVASGIELERWAMSVGLWLSSSEAIRNPDRISHGDIAILQRGNRSGDWRRHVCRVLNVDGDVYRAVGGNERDRWRITERSLRDRRLRGFVRYPDVEPDFDLQSELFERSRKWLEQLDPMDEIAALISQLGAEAG